MPERSVAFVLTGADAGAGDSDHDVIVLDPWHHASPASGLATAARPVLPAMLDVLRAVDVPTVALEEFDRWATRAGLPDLFRVHGVSWWSRTRMTLRWDVYELVLWRMVVGHLLDMAGWTRAEVPASRPMLGEACRALGLAVEVAAGSAPATLHQAAPSEDPPRRKLNAIQRRLAVRGLGTPAPAEMQPILRRELLERRARRIARRRPVLALTWTEARQVSSGTHGAGTGDPYLDPAIERLRASGQPLALIELGSSHKRDADWVAMAGADDVLPSTFVTEYWGRHEARQPTSAGPDPATVLRSGVLPRLDIDGCDLAAAARNLVAGYAGEWMTKRLHTAGVAGRCLDDLRPSAVLLDREGTRSTWIAAARERGIPVVSTQHGMIYPGNPEFFLPAESRDLRPDVTCVFGTYERDLLVDRAGYSPGSVVVTGSPRVPSVGVTHRDAATRAAVRRDLALEDDERLLVVSAAHNDFGELLTASMLATVLDGPLPRTRVVVKVHPQDHAPADFEGFLAAQAVAGGYPPPRVTVVRDVDVMDLLAAADAHLGQASTMLTDAVAAGTPNMVAVSLAHSDLIGYAPAGVAVPVRSALEVEAFLDAPVTPEPGVREAFLRSHFEPGDAAARLADVVLEAGARRTR